MIQVATLLGSVMSGLRDQYYPKGNAIYAVRDGEQFLYIGQTTKGVWKRIRFHILKSDNAFGSVTRANWLSADKWRVEVCYFGDEAGTKLLERALIRWYCPVLNRADNRGVPEPPYISLTESDRVSMSESCQLLLMQGWPSFGEIALEPPAWQKYITQASTRARRRRR